MSYEKWSPGYWCLRKYICFADWLVNKKTIITGRKKIPDNTPLVIAANHQNALSDPLAILLHLKVQPVWLARADIFGKSKFIDIILKFLKIMPVYRYKDGKENLKKNEQTFSDSIKVLENNSALALFPEAAHSFRRQMLVHKKAIPRIVFMTYEKSIQKPDIRIIPAGIYYSHYWKLNRTVIINFGDPIPVSNYLKLYEENQNAAIIELKSKIHDSIKPLVIDFQSKTHYEGLEQIRELYGKHFLIKRNIIYSPLNLFKSDQLLAGRLDQLEKTYPEETVNLINDAKDFNEILREFKLRNWLFDPDQRHVTTFITDKLILIAGLPVFLYGFIFNAVPFYLIDKIIRKKVKDKSFWSTFFFVSGIIVFPLFYLGVLLTVGWFLPGLWLKIVFLVSLPLAGKLALKWYILFKKTTGRGRYLYLKRFNKNSYQKILKKREKLFDKLDLMLPAD